MPWTSGYSMDDPGVPRHSAQGVEPMAKRGVSGDVSPQSNRFLERQHVRSLTLVLVVLAVLTNAGSASAWPVFRFSSLKSYPRGVLITWSGVSDAESYQLKVRKTSQPKSAGYVFTLPPSRRSFRLRTTDFPARRRAGAYVFTVCAVTPSGRRCMSVGAHPDTTGTKVPTAHPRAAASKANSCLAQGEDALVTTGAVGAFSLLIPGAGEVTATAIVAIAAATGAATYAVCSLRSRGDAFVADDIAYMTSIAGDYGGGGGGGGGSWRTDKPEVAFRSVGQAAGGRTGASR